MSEPAKTEVPDAQWDHVDSEYGKRKLGWKAGAFLGVFLGVFALSVATNKRPMSNRITESRVMAQSAIVVPLAGLALYNLLLTDDPREKEMEDLHHHNQANHPHP
eukprot:gb/GEZN01024896.1/.p1 GENE.gb/GEZN01024896.1/~~gb/GEZN01024896.1/.p1  ORF type:complete len:105 (-),score=8.58 gb/GEZN01024896.1/:208-522(-)